MANELKHSLAASPEDERPAKHQKVDKPVCYHCAQEVPIDERKCELCDRRWCAACEDITDDDKLPHGWVVTHLSPFSAKHCGFCDCNCGGCDECVDRAQCDDGSDLEEGEIKNSDKEEGEISDDEKASDLKCAVCGVKLFSWYLLNESHEPQCCGLCNKAWCDDCKSPCGCFAR